MALDYAKRQADQGGYKEIQTNHVLLGITASEQVLNPALLALPSILIILYSAIIISQ